MAEEEDMSPTPILRVVRESKVREKAERDESHDAPMLTVSVGHAEHVEEEEELDSELVLAFVAETGCPVYSSAKIKAEDACTLLLTPDQVDPDKVCCRIPPSYPGIGSWLFVISLDHIDPDDLSYDDLGRWAKPSGRRHFFGKADDDTLRRFAAKEKDPGPVIYDYCVRCNRYNHLGVDEPEKKVQKWIYVAFNDKNDLLGPYAIIQYVAEVPPCDLRRVVHAGAKPGNIRSAQRTKPSAIKQAKELLLTHTPRQVMETMLAQQAVAGDDDPASIPKNVAQVARAARNSGYDVSNLAANIPGSRRAHRGRPRGSRNRARDSFEPYEVAAFNEASPPPSAARTSLFRNETHRDGKFDALQVQVMHAEKRKHEIEAEKLENENELVRISIEKVRLEMDVLKAKKYKLDVELGKVIRQGGDEENVVIVEEEGMEYRDEYQ